MFCLQIVFLAAIAVAVAKPGIPVAAPLVAAAPVVAPAPFVTASSSQYISRNYNGVVAAPLVAAPVYAPAAKIVAPAASYVAAPASYLAASPYVAAASPYVAAASPYVAAPYYASAPIVALK